MKAPAILGITFIAMSGHAYANATYTKGDMQLMWAVTCFFEALVGMALLMGNHTYL